MVVNLLKRAPELRHVDLGGEPLHQGVARTLRLSCHRLHSLAFSTRPVPDTDLVSLFSSPPAPLPPHLSPLPSRLTHLDLGAHPSLLPGTLLDLAQLLPNLRHLALRSNRTLATPGATDDLARFLTIVAPRLESLDARGSQAFMEDEVITALTKHGAGSLTRLDLGAWEADVDPAEAATSSAAADLPPPATLSKDSLVALRHLSKLTHLRLPGQPALTDLTVSALVSSMPNLLAFDSSGCRITDLAVASVAAHCPLVRWIDVAECAWVGDKALVALGGEGGGKALRAVDVGGTDVSEERLGWLVARRSSLTHVGTRGGAPLMVTDTWR
ncbi:RNI-like protein [Gonapodya prolifera JEL478]|uniref:RNI-like protein n=1 Tax=Gonapodya prolifera (strain JEL478) TaxID=1344416 RepID=A0A139AKM6_GONPJ|nr:RNI-like protein [Gonapodya prolifera JEL478]|eukprot:KXS17248.1 RNI-like protein [Gonapodya prolifera JEL478]